MSRGGQDISHNLTPELIAALGIDARPLLPESVPVQDQDELIQAVAAGRPRHYVQLWQFCLMNRHRPAFRSRVDSHLRHLRAPAKQNRRYLDTIINLMENYRYEGGYTGHVPDLTEPARMFHIMVGEMSSILLTIKGPQAHRVLDPGQGDEWFQNRFAWVMAKEAGEAEDKVRLPDRDLQLVLQVQDRRRGRHRGRRHRHRGETWATRIQARFGKGMFDKKK